MSRWFAVAAVVALLAGCGSARRRQPVAPPVNLAEARASRGEVLFMRYCHKCHPGAEAGLGPAIANRPRPDFLRAFQIRHGLGAMPGFKDVLSDAQVSNILAYIGALRRNRPIPENLRHSQAMN